ncbi:hypothetical protein ASF53_13960 [Methylobacterium sp. Leaf123]|uniref:hypothetical protein n=1 Tax=Methylobacterium sp. Leaf123 TaxID=1736264 RepID=UPI0006F38926|nr:hypothetical protein [Methylobacterium sp. Leaf123]KQQ13275.1 hypothetical protein ASF53_13960 [Methylobacterium sp. Leaf123]
MSVRPAGAPVGRTLAALFSNQLYAVNFGVLPGAADNGPALRTAFARAQELGSNLLLPDFDMNVCAGADPDALLRIERPMNLSGQGRNSRILPCANAGDRAVILVKPGINAGGIRGLTLRDFSIGYLATRIGGDGIRFDTTNLNGFIAKPLVNNVSIADAGPGKYAIHHINNPDPATGNITGGLFGGTFSNSDFFGGMRFYKTGDSNNVLHNIIAGNNTGVEYEGIGGAATHLFFGNNITSYGGAFVIRNTIQPKIISNQTEGFHTYTGTYGALITLDGSHDGVIEENNANAYDRVDVVRLVNGASGNTVGDNTVTYSTAAGKVMTRVVGSPGNTIARQRSDTDFTRTPNGPGEADDGFNFAPRTRTVNSVDATSHPTIGAFQQLTLNGAWSAATDPDYNQGLSVQLLPDNSVALRGSVVFSTPGTPQPVGTLVATLPPAYRPSKSVRIGADMLVIGSPNSWGRAVFIIDKDGGVYVQSANSGYLIHFDSTSFSRL